MPRRKLTKEEMKDRRNILSNRSLSKPVREAAHREIQEQMMNPKTDAEFDPENFDPMEGIENHDIVKRVREVAPKRLPNPHGLKPKKILEGQMIGMYESKQDLYLLICALYERVADLEDQLNNPQP